MTLQTLLKHAYLGCFLLFGLLSCANEKQEQTNKKPEVTEKAIETLQAGNVVNVYSHRHYKADQELFEQFERQTGVKVNVIKASADELINRMQQEGENCPADVLITVDAGRLFRAKEMGLLQPLISMVINQNVPQPYRDDANHWFGLTRRARVFAYSKDRVKPSELSTYEALTDEKWRGRVLVRSSSNIYNQSLLASMIANGGKEKAKSWAAGMVANMARPPKGNDRDQVKAIAQGLGDVAIVNTYYIGKLLESDNEEEQKAGAAVGIFFPKNSKGKTHVNISGIGIARYAPNIGNAMRFAEFLTSAEAQRKFAVANHEYPVNPEIPASELLDSWGTFEGDEAPFEAFGVYNSNAVKIFDEVGWK